MAIGKLFKRNRILGDREAEIRARERELLDRLATALARFGPDVDADDLVTHNAPEQHRQQEGEDGKHTTQLRRKWSADLKPLPPVLHPNSRDYLPWMVSEPSI